MVAHPLTRVLHSADVVDARSSAAMHSSRIRHSSSLLEGMFDRSRSATLPPLVQAVSVDAHLVWRDVLWTDALLVQDPRDRFWRIHSPGNVDALALPHNIAMRFRDRLEPVSVEHRTDPRGVAFGH